MAELATTERVEVPQYQQISAETRAIFASAQSDDHSANIKWLEGISGWLVEIADDKGVIPSEVHGTVGKKDRAMCQTFNGAVTEWLGAEIAPMNAKVVKSRVSQVLSSAVMKSLSPDYGIEGFLTVIPAKKPTPANKGGKLVVHPEVIANAIADPAFTYEAKAPKAIKTETNPNKVAKEIAPDAVKRLGKIVSLFPKTDTPKIVCKVSNGNGGTETANGDLPTDDKDNAVGQACLLLSRLSPEMLSADGLASALKAT